jgi:protease secretion system membrane fusion protein
MNPKESMELQSANKDAEPAKAQGEVNQLQNTNMPIRFGFWVLIVGLGLFFLWAALAPLDEGVPAPGMVSVEMRRTTIQHLQGGVVKAVRVKEGADVAVGDVLIELDDAMLRAAQQALRQQYLGQRALEARLVAELLGSPALDFHPDLKNANDPLAVQHMSVQTQLFNARRAVQIAEQSAGDQVIAGLRSQEASVEQAMRERRNQASTQQSQLASMRALADEGFAPRNQALQLEQAQSELAASMANLESELRRMQSGAAEQRLRLAGRKQEYAKEASAQLADLRRELQANYERLQATEEELGRMQIRSPAAGQVIGLTVRNPGGVVQHGQPLMDILPRDVPLVLDVKVPQQAIDNVKLGQEVEVRFAAFASTPHLVVLGRLVSVSGDVVTEQVGNMVSVHYTARVQLTDEGMKALGSHRVHPGMNAEVLIRTGERSLFNYMVSPLLRRVSTSLTER